MPNAPTEPTRLDPTDRRPVAAWAFDADEGAPTVIGVHDLTANGLHFGDLAEVAHGSLRIVAPDLRGRAGSLHAPPAGGLGDHVDDVVALADEVGATRFDVVGHGTGAAIALQVAAAAPGRVRRVVLLDGPPVVAADPDGDWVTAAATVDPGVGRLRRTWAHRDAAVTEGVASGRLPADGLTRALRRATDAEIAGSGFGWGPRLAARSLARDWALLGGWRPPVLDGDVAVTTFRAAHGHRVDDPPLALVDLDAPARTLDATHTGLLTGREALRRVVDALLAADGPAAAP